MDAAIATVRSNTPWNRGRLIGPKQPLRLKNIWAFRIRLQLARKVRDLALFNLATDSKLRGCDLVALRVRDVPPGVRVSLCVLADYLEWHMREVWRELIFADEVLTTLNARQKRAFELLQQIKSQTEARTPNSRQVPGERSKPVRRLQGLESKRK